MQVITIYLVLDIICMIVELVLVEFYRSGVQALIFLKVKIHSANYLKVFHVVLRCGTGIYL